MVVSSIEAGCGEPMIEVDAADRLIEAALRLTGIALLRASRSAPSPRSKRALNARANASPEAEAHRQRDLEHRRAGLRHEAQRAGLDAAPAQVVAERLAGPGAEEAVEMKRREVRHRGERLQVERRIEVLRRCGP